MIESRPKEARREPGSDSTGEDVERSLATASRLWRSLPRCARCARPWPRSLPLCQWSLVRTPLSLLALLPRALDLVCDTLPLRRWLSIARQRAQCSAVQRACRTVRG